MKTKKRKPVTTHQDTRNLIRHPARIPAALAAIPPTEPPPAAVEAFNALVAGMDGGQLAEAHSGETGRPGGQGAADAGSAGVRLAPSLPRANCVNLLGRLVNGSPFADALAASGMTWAHAHLCEVLDPDGFGRLLVAAGRHRDRIFKARARDALLQRAVEGVEEPLIGRVGKDLDGVVATRRRYSDKLLEFGLSRMDRETFAEPERGAQQINVGHQVVYNIQGVPMAAQKPPIEAEATETTAEKGENLIALPDVDTD